jgi:hypothetical protein
MSVNEGLIVYSMIIWVLYRNEPDCKWTLALLLAGLYSGY